MGQGSITQGAKAGSPIEGILGALQAVHTYYGIDTQQAQQKLLASELAQKDEALKTTQSRNDPNSSASKLAQFQAAAENKLYQNKLPGAGDLSQMQSIIMGHPARFAENGPENEPTPAVAGLSAAELDANKEASPLAKAYQAQMVADAAKSRMDYRDVNFNTREQNKESKEARLAANKDPELVTSQNRLNGLLRVNDIIKKVESGELKGTTQIKNSIANEYAKLETGGSAGLGQSERAQMANTLQGDANDLWTRLSGHINADGSISPDQMKQLKGELGTMGESYMQQFDQRHSMLREGFTYPQSTDIFDKKVSSVRDSFAKRFGGWSGLQAPSSGSTSQGIQMGNAPAAAPAAATTAQADQSDPTVLQYSKIHGLDYGTSQAILKKRGYAGSTAAK